MDRYTAMQEEPMEIDETDVVMYPMVTYNPETVELHPEIKSQRPKKARERVLRYTCMISIGNVFVAVICAITSSAAISMSGSDYEPSLVVCVMVIFVSCLVWYLRYESKKILLDSVGATRTFLCCFISMVGLTVSTVVVTGVAMFVLTHGELDECYEATNKIGDLEINSCTDEMGTRYFLALLTVTLLAAIGVISVVLLCFYMSVGRKFSCKSRDKDDKGRVIVTQSDETGRKVVYGYKSERVNSDS
ncbi:uncharacterized protein LOC123557572 [Mercenaria mercenaria]|uniref:uncharacterized protein LOC123557572 n=1 Tax=Mercenaria mercenaria TaxID=6596 RepID=UPI00234E428E|nr:uncharacterized protein LOC123557572 [Mercenaria mercenaria]